MTKRCAKCGEAKALSEFWISSGKPYSYCKPCALKRKREWAAANLLRERERSRLNRAKNGPNWRQQEAAYRQRNKDQRSVLRAEWYRRNRELALERARFWAESNPERVKDAKRRYKQRGCTELEDWYVLRMLGLPTAPSAMLEAKRQIMKVERVLKEKRK